MTVSCSEPAAVARRPSALTAAARVDSTGGASPNSSMPSAPAVISNVVEGSILLEVGDLFGGSMAKLSWTGNDGANEKEVGAKTNELFAPVLSFPTPSGSPAGSSPTEGHRGTRSSL